MKTYGIIFFLICVLSACVSQPTIVKNWFPADTVHIAPIQDYINNFNSNDINVARDTYIFLLAFLDELIIAHSENLKRSLRFDALTVKEPALENGKLIIIESTTSISIHIRWDNVLEEYVEIGSSGNVIGEYTQMVFSTLLYNRFLDHWFSLTGELLGEYIEIDLEKVAVMLEYLVFCPESFYENLQKVSIPIP